MCYIVADAYNGSSALIKQVLKQGNHLITRAKSNCAACHLPSRSNGKPTRGRLQKYGARVKQKNLFKSTKKIERFTGPLYSEKGVTLKMRTLELMWEPAGQFINVVLVDHPHRGRWMLIRRI